MARYRKKPVVIDAIQWSGDILDAEKIMQFAAGRPVGFQGENLVVYTLEGAMLACPKDWLISGVKNELYPCKPEIFAATYEPA